jgi:hypothetical protein
MLIEAQNDLDQVRADLRALFEKVPWSVEPMDGWETHEEIDRLRARELELAELLVCHQYWMKFAPGDVQAARDALKHHREQEPASMAS